MDAHSANSGSSRRPHFVGPWRIWHTIERESDGTLSMVRPRWCREYAEEDGHGECCHHTEFLRGPAAGQ